MSIQFSDSILTEKFLEMAENVATIKTKLEVHTDELRATKSIVDRHETAYTVGKYVSIPVLGVFHLAARQFWNKLGF